MFSNFLITSALAAIIDSLPTDLQVRQTFNGAGLCYRNDRYTVLRDSPAWSSVQVADGQICTSNFQLCTVGENYSKSFGVTITAGGSLDLGEIFSINSAISYTTITTIGQSVGEPCPAGCYICGLTYTKNETHISGVKTTYVIDNCATAGDVVKTDDYSLTAPVMVGDTAQVTFAACISASSPNQDTVTAQIPNYPGNF